MSTFFRSSYQFPFLTHTVFLIPSLAGDPGMDWDYFSLSDHSRPEMRPYGDGTVELIMTVSTVDSLRDAHFTGLPML